MICPLMVLAAGEVTATERPSPILTRPGAGPSYGQVTNDRPAAFRP